MTYPHPDAKVKRDNSGTLSKNDRKEKDSHPDIRGSATIAGVDYWISGWAKEGRGGGKFYSLAFKPKDEDAAPAPKNSSARDESDDIPFN